MYTVIKMAERKTGRTEKYWKSRPVQKRTRREELTQTSMYLTQRRCIV